MEIKLWHFKGNAKPFLNFSTTTPTVFSSFPTAVIIQRRDVLDRWQGHHLHQIRTHRCLVWNGHRSGEMLRELWLRCVLNGLLLSAFFDVLRADDNLLDRDDKGNRHDQPTLTHHFEPGCLRGEALYSGYANAGF